MTGVLGVVPVLPEFGVGCDRQQLLELGSENRLSAIRKILINPSKANATLYKSFCEK